MPTDKILPAVQAASDPTGDKNMILMLRSQIKELLGALVPACAALRSYQHGNASPELAEEIADFAEPTIAKAEKALK